MAYWQNGKLYVIVPLQSTAQTVPAVARWMGIEPTDVVVISEYTVGVRGKVSGALTLVIRAFSRRDQRASDDANQPRRGAHIGRARTPLHDAESRIFPKKVDPVRSTCYSSRTTGV